MGSATTETSYHNNLKDENSSFGHHDAKEKIMVTQEELNRFDDALKQEGFRKMLVEYAEEISDPENRALREKEIQALEREQGMNVEFMHPMPGCVLKCLSNANSPMKVFVNICVESKVREAQCVPVESHGKKGSQWTLPFILAQPRDDFDKAGKKCVVHDIMFHPITYKMTENNTSFRKMVEDTALDAVESKFKIKLCRDQIRYPKLKYKGAPGETVIRTKVENACNIDNVKCDISADLMKPSTITPKYTIRHRSEVSLQDFRNSPDSNTSTRPKELVIEIDLPLVEKSSDVKVDVIGRKLKLESNAPNMYSLDMSLPYPVNEDDGKAEFNKTSQKLTVVLPVVNEPDVNYKLPSFDGDCESENICLPNSKLVNRTSRVSNNNPEENLEVNDSNGIEDLAIISEMEIYKAFATSNDKYWLPPYDCFQTNDSIIFLLKVKNVNSDSVNHWPQSDGCGCNIIFSSIGSGFVPFYYSFILRFQDNIGPMDIIHGSKNIVLRFDKVDKTSSFETFRVGVSPEQLSEATFLTDKSIKNRLNKIEVENESGAHQLFDVAVGHITQDELKVNMKLKIIPEPIEEVEENAYDVCDENNENTSQNLLPKTVEEIKKMTKPRKPRSMSESATDDLKVNKRRGILKVPQSPLRRTMSESSDETSQSSQDSMNDLHKSQSSPDIPEEEYSTEDADKPKKTVRFMDKVSKNLYRSNSSILGQRKKNQRKTKNKKKNALKRSNSDCGNSSCSEAELAPESNKQSVGTNSDNCHLPENVTTSEIICDQKSISDLNRTTQFKQLLNTEENVLSDGSNNDDSGWIKKKSKRNKRKVRKSKIFDDNGDSGTVSMASNTEESGENLEVYVASPDLYEID